MTQTSPQDDRLVRVYALALRFYPAPFQQAYASSMRQTFGDALRDNSIARRSLLPLVLRDLVKSLAKEHIAMLFNAFARPALIFNALVLTGLATVLALALYAIPQQLLRRGADDPQVEMADNLVGELEQGITAGNAIPADTVDLTRSLSPFLIVYDDQGQPLASQATLYGKTPKLPPDLLDSVRQSGERRFTWKPGNSIRIAAVVQRVNGSNPGFVLAGRSLREEGKNQKAVQQMAGVTWAAMLALILVGTASFGWYTRPRAA